MIYALIKGYWSLWVAAPLVLVPLSFCSAERLWSFDFEAIRSRLRFRSLRHFGLGLQRNRLRISPGLL